MKTFANLLLLTAHACDHVTAFVHIVSKANRGRRVSMQMKSVDSNASVVERRTALNIFGAALTGLTTIPSIVHASGGATAGGAYLLSAKQRYNKRVTSGITSFLTLEKSLESGSFDLTKDFFNEDVEGTWKDLSSSGYLLSNAFRRSSTTPPDNLPSVQKWKLFAADVAPLEKLAKKGKDSASALTAWKKAEGSLDAYLGAVELPSVADMK